ncbi:MAG: peptidoglycan recognition family protein [Candidatus Nanopelagicales bacterium]|nr:peptidoglycan recognition family protein [Candidatus Nanopelagicales bacterium]
MLTTRTATAGAIAMLVLVAGCASTSAAPPPATQSTDARVESVTGPASDSAPVVVPPPRIVKRYVQYGKQRKRQMAEYSYRHYGKREWRLTPKVIVEHYTATNSLSSVFSTFSSNARDPELHELPGTCTHFVIDRNGTIYQLVPLTVRCRHTVGLNHSAIGIEHVGMSDSAVMSNRRQVKASLHLTAWLMGTYSLAIGDVIGHNENLRSPLHYERNRAWRCQTHGDFRPATMNRYRKLVKPLAKKWSLKATPPKWRRSRC